MAFFSSMFVCNLTIPIVMIIAGYMMYKHPPKQINSLVGYRTTMSRLNLDTWKFAQTYCGKLWVYIGCIVLVPTIIVQLFFIKSSVDTISWATIIIETVQLIVMLISILKVEKALKTTFDKNGNRI